MLSRTSADDGSGRRGALISLSSLSVRWLAVAALSVVVPIVIALAVTELYGPLFGVWGWVEAALILLLAETVVLLAFGMYRGEHNPYRSVVPGASHWAMHSNDPLVLYAGTLRAPVSADARVSSNAKPLLLAIAPALGTLVMLGVVLAGSSGDSSETQPVALPIVEVDGSISMMLESVEVTPERLTLAIRIDDLEWGRSSLGYLIPLPQDIAIDGQPISETALQSAGFTSISGTFTSWRLHLPLALPADPTQPLTVTIDTLRFAPNRYIPGLPEKIAGDWSFTFVPATS